MLLSIIIPVLNEAQHLQRLLTQLLHIQVEEGASNQQRVDGIDLLSMEIIVADGG